MLSLMPQSPPLPAHESMSQITMSLAILPPPPMTSYSQSSTPTPLAPSPSSAKRPKLSLDTNNVTAIFGQSTTSLRLDSASSPTARNTFRNAFDPTARPPGSRPSKPTLKQLSTNILPEPITEPSAPEATPLIHSASSSSSSTASISTVDSTPAEIPYKLSYSISSILVNSPIPRSRTRRTMFAQPKPMFPAAKRVSFKTPLTEDVKNVNFTMRHSDIESSTSTISTLELSPPEDAAEKASIDQPELQKRTDQEHTSPQTGDKRESSDDEDSDSTPQTPGPSGRRKRHRLWAWTLGPIDSQDSPKSEARKESNNCEQHKTENL